MSSTLNVWVFDGPKEHDKKVSYADGIRLASLGQPQEKATDAMPTDGAGNIAFMRMPDGDYTLYSVIPNFEPWQKDIHLPLTEDRVDVELTRTGSSQTPQPPQPSGPLSRLHVEGWDIYDERGQRYVSNGVTDFSLLQSLLELDRAPVDADLDDHIAGGYEPFAEHRITTLMSVISSQRGRRPLKPENYGRYWDTFEWLNRALLARSRMPEWTLSCDRVPMGLDDGYLKRHVGQAFEILKQGPNLVEGVNEIEHDNNRVDPSRVFTDVPGEIFFCCGSSLSGGRCLHFGRDNFSNFHDSRDAKKTYLDANPIEQIIGWGDPNPFVGLNHPIRVNEFPGARNTADGWRRYSDPTIARRLGTTVRAWAGGVFHVEHGIFSEPLDDVEKACAQAWCAR